MTNEGEQLRAYAISGSNDIFAGIVQRNLPMIYAVARRRLNGDSHRAQDVAQQVCIAMARNAAALARHPNFAGWIFLTTRFLAAKAARTEERRHARESQAATNGAEQSGQIRPGETPPRDGKLDDAVAELREIDRRMILLRFHRSYRLAEIGMALDLTENAVQKRLDRALVRLREKLTRRGVTSSVAALGTALKLQGAVSVPPGLATLSTQAGLAAQASATGLLGWLRAATLGKLQIAAVAAAVITGSAVTVWQFKASALLRAQLQSQAESNHAQIAVLTQQLEMQREHARSAEADLSQLLQVSRAPGPGPVQLVSTRDFLLKAERQMAALLREGKKSEALDVCMQAYLAFRTKEPGSVEGQSLMSDMVELGRTFSPALAALRQFRDAALQDFYAGRDPGKTAVEAAELNQRLGEGTQTMALYDSLPGDSPYRQSLALLARADFVAARRYPDALIGENYGQMLNQLDQTARLALNQPGRAAQNRAALINQIAVNIEVLTGAGETTEAQEMTAKLLSFDSQESTRALIAEHVRRATAPP